MAVYCIDTEANEGNEMNKTQQVLAIMRSAVLYVPAGGEEQRINAVFAEEKCFLTTGEETGIEYTIGFDDVDLDKDLFYRLSVIEVDRHVT